MKKTNRTYIGGQAVVSGVMMRGKRGMATVVRDDKVELHTEAKRITPPEKRSVFTRIPFVRGIVNFVSTLVVGMGTMLRSSEVAFSEEETPSKFSKWLEEKWNASTGDLLTALAAIAADRGRGSGGRRSGKDLVQPDRGRVPSRHIYSVYRVYAVVALHAGYLSLSRRGT